MVKALVVLLVLLAAVSCNLMRTHDYWYTAQKKVVQTGAPLADTAWNYCDLKCLYLERYYPGKDFIWMEFSESVFKPNFGACYVANGAAKNLWNTVATNNWYETYCGKEFQDYFAKSTGSDAKYEVKGTYGVGVGKQEPY